MTYLWIAPHFQEILCIAIAPCIDFFTMVNYNPPHH